MSRFEPSESRFEASEHSFGASDAEPSAPGSNQAAYAAAAYWLGRAAGLAASYTEKAKLLAYATKASAEANALGAVPGGALVYGSEVAILTDAATHASSVPSVMSKLLALQGGVLEARKAAQRANPVYQGERAASALPWLFGGALLVAAAAFARHSGRPNPSNGWRALFDQDVEGGFRDMSEASADFASVRSARDLVPVARRGARRGFRRAVRADSARQVLQLAGVLR